MEEEIQNFLKVWISIWICLSYCYGVGERIPHGITRFLFIFPVISLFLYLPLILRSLHLGGLTAFFIAWLANFKLLLFAAGQGPLAAPGMSIGTFCAVASFPVKLKQNPFQKTSEAAINGGSARINDTNSNHNRHRQSLLNYTVKILLVAALVKAYDYTHILPQKLLWLFLCFHIYFLLELSLAAAASAVAFGGTVELLPLFHQPYLSTSLQDFWGRRWNLVVTGILRPAVFRPAASAATKLLGSRWAPLAGVTATFLVSAVMHELMFFYMSRQWPPPTWEVMAFFVFHGGCLVAEMAVKRLWIDTWQMRPLPAAVSVPVTVGFFFWTCFWLFFPPFINTCKADVRVVEEYAIFGAFVKNNIPSSFWSNFNNNIAFNYVKIPF
ncbi:acyl-CoA--sterol O-acyltransferase 1-like [Benincasa hispida]|uniref:acyl-CoA--sterol O-acyltransferase 1-like n=1 Tax=Benincasa hispida TaxID=102211 RepID=UPI001901EC49|nr:acyl-CoA--sterol O-acyltransferase 1-like [Benincasa hispida]